MNDWNAPAQSMKLCLLIAVACLALPVGVNRADAEQRRYVFGGYCVVALLDSHLNKQAAEVVKGNKQWEVNFDGKWYRFSSKEAKSKFVKNPVKYMPAMGGDCVVCYVLSPPMRKPGINYQFHGNRIFLFPDGQNVEEQNAARRVVQKFLNNKAKYDIADIIVHKAPATVVVKQKDINRWTALKNGFRHTFSNEKQFKDWLKANKAIDFTTTR